MTAHSFLDVLLGKPSAVARDHAFLERERHANVRRGNLSYPIRGIRPRTSSISGICGRSCRAGDPKAWFAVGDYGDVDGSKTKHFILERAEQPAMSRYFELNFGMRPAEELFDLRKDPAQLVNVADAADYAAPEGTRGRVEQWMRDTGDPRVDPANDAWDEYPYFGGRVVDEQGNKIPGKEASRDEAHGCSLRVAMPYPLAPGSREGQSWSRQLPYH